MQDSMLADWCLAMTNEDAFQAEQAHLEHAWTLLGVTNEVAGDKDWISAKIGGRSVFVQRFGDRLKGFENRCPHRFFPLRTADKGNGPLVCGFHHWRYNEDGQAYGIPHCVEVFGMLPKELNARLKPIDIATCGSLIFGRIPSEEHSCTLEEFLGEGFNILEKICTIPETYHEFSDDIAANWRLPVEITLDDYHLVAIHHRKSYSFNEEMTYYKFGDHSAQFVHTNETLSDISRQCRDNTYHPSGYRIFNIFPNLVISLFPAAPYWYCNVQQFVPVSVGACRQRGWFFNTGLGPEESALSRLARPISEIIRARIVRHYIEKIGDEDHRACEKLQQVARQADTLPLFSSQEKRVGWFEETYARWVMRGNAGQG